MTIKTNPVEGLEIDVGWVNHNPKDWRSRPDPEDGFDEDGPTPRGVVGILGFDPDDEGWEEEVKSVKHLPGQHDQSTHGRGSSGSTDGSGWKKFETVREAEEWAQGRIANKVDYSKIKDVRVANKVNQVLGELKDEYKDVEIEALGLSRLEDGVGARTTSFTITGGGKEEGVIYLDLNESVWKDAASFRAAAEGIPHTLLVDRSAKGALTHEFGHVLDKTYGSSGQSAYATHKEDIGLVSDYAGYNHKELTAEAFTLYNNAGQDGIDHLNGSGFGGLVASFDRWKR